jgi:hypothetical protein
MKHVYYGPEYSEAEISAPRQPAESPPHGLPEDSTPRRTAAPDRRWQSARLVPGPHGIRPARPRQSQHPRRSPPHRHEGHPQQPHQTPREPFRPFCPSIRAESTGDYFETSYPSPFMVRPTRSAPASAADSRRHPRRRHRPPPDRRKDVNPLYWKLLRASANSPAFPSCSTPRSTRTNP